MLGKVVMIHETDEDCDMGLDEEQKLRIATGMNELAYTKFIISLDGETIK
jgi:hypothetical protein